VLYQLALLVLAELVVVPSAEMAEQQHSVQFLLVAVLVVVTLIRLELLLLQTVAVVAVALQVLMVVLEPLQLFLLLL
jgi:hypothetical protein